MEHVPRGDRWWTGLAWGTAGGTLLVAAVALPLAAAAPYVSWFTGRAGDDAWSGFEYLLRVPLPTFLLVLLLAAQAAAMGLWGLRRICDPAHEARDALRWSLRRGLLLLALTLPPLALLQTRAEGAVIGLSLALLLGSVLLPFVSWNVAALSSPEPRWRYAWPGGAVVRRWFVIVVVVACTGLLLGFVDTPAAALLDVGLATTAFLLQARLWLSPQDSCGSASRTLLQWRHLGPALWSLALIAALEALLAACIAAQTLFATYLAPQIEVSLRADGLVVPWWIDRLAALGAGFGADGLWLFPGAVVSTLVVGRLTWRSLATRGDDAQLPARAAA